MHAPFASPSVMPAISCRSTLLLIIIPACVNRPLNLHSISNSGITALPWTDRKPTQHSTVQHSLAAASSSSLAVFLCRNASCVSSVCLQLAGVFQVDCDSQLTHQCCAKAHNLLPMLVQSRCHHATSVLMLGWAHGHLMMTGIRLELHEFWLS